MNANKQSLATTHSTRVRLPSYGDGPLVGHEHDLGTKLLL